MRTFSSPFRRPYAASCGLVGLVILGILMGMCPPALGVPPRPSQHSSHILGRIKIPLGYPAAGGDDPYIEPLLKMPFCKLKESYIPLILRIEIRSALLVTKKSDNFLVCSVL